MNRGRILNHFALPLSEPSDEEHGISDLFEDVARKMDKNLPVCPEKSAGLRFLLQARDCFLRASRENTNG